MIIGGCLDGSLQIFSAKQNYHRPEILLRHAHDPSEDYSSIVSFNDNVRIATRHTDGTLKVWDIRKLVRPILH
jgi:WD40 repeat protein